MTAVPRSNTVKPVRRRGEAAVDRRLLACLPFSCSNRRTRGWSIKRQLAGGDTLEAYAAETITVSDMLTCFSLYSLVQDARRGGVAEEKEINGNVYVGVSLGLTSACLRAAGHRNIKEFVSTLKRLFSYQCVYTRAGGQVVTQKYFLDLDIDQEKGVSILISKKTLDALTTHGWIVKVEEVRKIKGDRAKAFALWLNQQPGQTFKEQTIFDLLGFGAAKNESRKELRGVIKSLITAGILSWGRVGGGKVELSRNPN